MRHDGPIRAERGLVGKTSILFPGSVDEVASGVGRIAHHQDRDGIDHLPHLALCYDKTRLALP
jgi:hypothetical protein